jgi:DNA polymerase I
MCPNSIRIDYFKERVLIPQRCTAVPPTMRRASLVLQWKLPCAASGSGGFVGVVRSLSRAAPAAAHTYPRPHRKQTELRPNAQVEAHRNEFEHQQAEPKPKPEIATSPLPAPEPTARIDDTSELNERELHDALLLAEADIPGVTVVRDARGAARALRELTTVGRDSFIAWDTETTGIDPTVESPYGKGHILCLSAYGGAHMDFGSGPKLFVDCVDGEGGEELLQMFRRYFENDNLFKVWHNYSFDSHMLKNHGIKVAGFGGDTMHMSRLVDTSRKRYSLEELCKDYLDESLQKRPMKERFGSRRILKDGTMGKDIIVPSTLDMHRTPKHRRSWIEYAVSDAELTHRLMETLSGVLSSMSINGVNSEDGAHLPNMKNLYEEHFVPFGNMLIDMERTGFKVDLDMLIAAQFAAEKDRNRLEDSFRDWAAQQCPDARYMNINSGKQKQQLFFAPYKNASTKEEMSLNKEFTVEQTGIMADRYANELARAKLAAELESELDAQNRSEIGNSGLKSKSNPKPGPVSPPKRPRSNKMKKDIVLTGLGLASSGLTAGGWPSVSADALRQMAGNPRSDPPLYGTAQDPATCLAIDDIMGASAVSTLLSGFIIPLQAMTDAGGRIHASLNLNTETGRLSSRRPNLQNQPALEKDRYRIRNAFVCEPRNQLIVADYGQLELRLLAHITACRSMIDAFELGGDFHSRTALTMYTHVADAVKRGDCLLEWNGDDGTTPTVPLLKDMFATERRRAKTLNFSIAYGKTAIGLSKDWGINVTEANETLDLWYKQRQEVKVWQNECREFARKHKFVETILGRRRHLPDINSRVFKARGHAERAAINAPLQGSAADLVMMAMVKLYQNDTLQSLGWRVILQVHDEIILEGPQYSSEIARDVIKEVMLHPVDFPLRVGMTVEPCIAGSWFAAK